MKFRMLLSALLLAAGVVFVAGCGEKGDSNKAKETEKPNPQAQTPQGKAAAAFWDAMFVKCDVEAAKGMMVEGDFKKNVHQWIEQFQNNKKQADYAEYANMIAKAKIGNVTVNGDTAKVSMVFVNEGEPREVKDSVVLKQVGDKWLVESFKVDL